MYVPYLGLKQSPFRTAPDPAYFFASGLHLRAVERVVHAIRERAGLVLVLGEIGQGKTTVCRYVQARHSDEFLMGYLGNPFLDVQEFGRQMLMEFGLSGDIAGSGDIICHLTAFLREEDSKGRVVVLFLDEAHLLSPDVLEFLLIITNIQHQGRHLLQMVLAGQNEFQEILCQPRFSSLNQRLGNRVIVTDLERDDVAAYIRFRWDQAGGKGRDVFSSGAVTSIWKVTSGNPRLINQVCEALLQGAYERRAVKIFPEDVERLSKNQVFARILFPEAKNAGKEKHQPMLAGTLLLLAVVGVSAALVYGNVFGVREAAQSFFSQQESGKPAQTRLARADLAGSTSEGSLAGSGQQGSVPAKAAKRQETVAPQEFSSINDAHELSVSVPKETSVETPVATGSSQVTAPARPALGKKDEPSEESQSARTHKETPSVPSGGENKSKTGQQVLPDQEETLAARSAATDRMLAAEQRVPKAQARTQTEDTLPQIRVQERQAGKQEAQQTGINEEEQRGEAEDVSQIQPVEPEEPLSETDASKQADASPEPVLPKAPGIVVSAIVWDTLPRFRLAVVNERIVKQGDTVDQGYTVEAILKNSIRLSGDGRIFENSVHDREKKP